MQPFIPTEIFVEDSVKDLNTTKRIINKFPHLPITLVNDASEIKFPTDHTQAKKQLFINKLKGELLKSCQGKGDVCCLYHTIDLITNCHLECSYCILQDYLKNNPIITIHANIDEIFDEVRKAAAKEPDRIFRIGAGELSDSLALDSLTGFSSDCIALANEVKNIVFEFKTKTTNIDNLLKQKHKGNVVIAWSVNPEKYIKTEELKCDSLSDRLSAARKCADHGDPIAFHFDPLLYYTDWKTEYTKVIDQIASQFSTDEIAWISVGSLRFTPGLKKISEKRFPNSKIMAGELFPMSDGKIRYFRHIREEMYKYLFPLILEKIGKVPHYMCMETPLVWKNVFGHIPDHKDVEKQVARRFI